MNTQLIVTIMPVVILLLGVAMFFNNTKPAKGVSDITAQLMIKITTNNQMVGAILLSAGTIALAILWH